MTDLSLEATRISAERENYVKNQRRWTTNHEHGITEGPSMKGECHRPCNAYNIKTLEMEKRKIKEQRAYEPR